MTLQLDPDVAVALAPMGEAMAATTPPARGDIIGRRQMWEPILAAASTAQPLPPQVAWTDHQAPTYDGDTITVRWYTSPDAAQGPAALFFHGGGYIFGGIDQFDGPVSRYVAASGVPMLSVEYRRAPEHPHPTPVEDGYAALRWLVGHAAELGVDPARIGVMGDSAGGGLAAALSILARERGGPAIAGQILLMPMLDDRTLEVDPEIEPYLIWSRDDSLTAWPAFLGDAFGTDDVPATAAPARLADARGLPPAYIEVGQLDMFRDEDLAYAAALSRAGVEVEFHLRPGVPHEFDSIAPDTDVSRRAVADRVRALRKL